MLAFLFLWACNPICWQNVNLEKGEKLNFWDVLILTAHVGIVVTSQSSNWKLPCMCKWFVKIRLNTNRNTSWRVWYCMTTKDRFWIEQRKCTGVACCIMFVYNCVADNLMFLLLYCLIFPTGSRVWFSTRKLNWHSSTVPILCQSFICHMGIYCTFIYVMVCVCVWVRAL